MLQLYWKHLTFLSGFLPHPPFIQEGGGVPVTGTECRWPWLGGIFALFYFLLVQCVSLMADAGISTSSKISKTKVLAGGCGADIAVHSQWYLASLCQHGGSVIYFLSSTQKRGDMLALRLSIRFFIIYTKNVHWINQILHCICSYPKENKQNSRHLRVSLTEIWTKISGRIVYVQTFSFLSP